LRFSKNLTSYQLATMLGAPVQRPIYNKTFYWAMHVITIGALAGILVPYILGQFETTPTAIKDVDAQNLLDRGLALYQHRCECENNIIGIYNFATFDRDAAENFCDTKIAAHSGEFIGTSCVTAVYKMSAQISKENIGLNYTSDSVQSKSTIEAFFVSAASAFAYDAWNTQTDQVRIMNLTLAIAIKSGAISGNVNLMSNQLDIIYGDFSNRENATKAIAAAIIRFLNVNNNDYLKACKPINCKEEVKINLWPLVIATIMFGINTLVSFMAPANALVNLRETIYINGLLKRFLDPHYQKNPLTDTEMDQLKHSDPATEAIVEHVIANPDLRKQFTTDKLNTMFPTNGKHASSRHVLANHLSAASPHGQAPAAYHPYGSQHYLPQQLQLAVIPGSVNETPSVMVNDQIEGVPGRQSSVQMQDGVAYHVDQPSG
jgi:hypothetical protein